jgi:hypothetical protein
VGSTKSGSGIWPDRTADADDALGLRAPGQAFLALITSEQAIPGAQAVPGKKQMPGW